MFARRLFPETRRIRPAFQGDKADKSRRIIILRLRASGASWYFDFSYDGISWWNKWSMARAFTPEGFGLYIKTNVADAVPIFGLFRYVADPDEEAVLQGDRIKYWSN